MGEVVKIVNDIKNGQIKPIYFLMGEEPYYIDKLSDYIEQNVLTEDEKGFNQTVLYGRDVSIEDIISSAKRYPMMAERQVIIVKEAQDLTKTIDKLESYAENPMPSTVLVICYKYKTLDKRKKVTKLLDKHGLVYESKKLYENQVGEWIKRVLQGKNYTIEPKASAMFADRSSRHHAGPSGATMRPSSTAWACATFLCPAQPLPSISLSPSPRCRGSLRKWSCGRTIIAPDANSSRRAARNTYCKSSASSPANNGTRLEIS